MRGLLVLETGDLEHPFRGYVGSAVEDHKHTGGDDGGAHENDGAGPEELDHLYSPQEGPLPQGSVGGGKVGPFNLSERLAGGA